MLKGVGTATICPALSLWLSWHGYSSAYCGMGGFSWKYQIGTFFATWLASDFVEFYYHRCGSSVCGTPPPPPPSFPRALPAVATSAAVSWFAVPTRSFAGLGIVTPSSGSTTRATTTSTTPREASAAGCDVLCASTLTHSPGCALRALLPGPSLSSPTNTWTSSSAAPPCSCFHSSCP